MRLSNSKFIIHAKLVRVNARMRHGTFKLIISAPYRRFDEPLAYELKTYYL